MMDELMLEVMNEDGPMTDGQGVFGD